MADTWDMISYERGAFADAIAPLPDDEWDKPSLCRGWNVRDVVGHVIASGEMTPPRFFAKFAASGFNFDRMVDKDSHAIIRTTHGPQMLERLRATVSTRNHPPGPATAMLGEIVIHCEDVLQPSGMTLDHPVEHVVAVADFYKSSNLIVGAKKRIKGVKLRATDAPWSFGEGSEVNGRMIDLVCVMTGRKSALERLEGPGVSTLSQRM